MIAQHKGPLTFRAQHQKPDPSLRGIAYADGVSKGAPSPGAGSDRAGASGEGGSGVEAAPSIEELLGDGRHAAVDVQEAIEASALQALQGDMWPNTYAFQELFRGAMDLTGLGWLETVVLVSMAFRLFVTLPAHVFSMKNAVR